MGESRRKARSTALALLARREHSAQELERKLLGKGYAAPEVSETLQALRSEGLQSDQRYAEAYAHERVRRGYGPLHIRFELEQRGVESVLIEQAVGAHEADWPQLLGAQRRKRFGAALPRDPRSQARQGAFLRQRGFSAEQIHRELSGQHSDHSDHGV